MKIWYGLVTLVIYTGLAFVVYLEAGTWRLPLIWAVLASQMLIGMIGLVFIPNELIAERMHPKGKDENPLGQVILGGLLVAQLAIAALDVGRWHFSTNVPTVLQYIALVVQAIGWAGLIWCMQTNMYFSSAIRLQPDRGQVVITTGPYGWIRHPGYAFCSLAFLSQSIAFGSWLSLLPALLIVVQVVYRTTLEERLLTADLPGYSDYAKQVRYRWIPGIW